MSLARILITRLLSAEERAALAARSMVSNIGSDAATRWAEQLIDAELARLVAQHQADLARSHFAPENGASSQAPAPELEPGAASSACPFPACIGMRDHGGEHVVPGSDPCPHTMADGRRCRLRLGHRGPHLARRQR